jgi:hypothetical protein
VQSQSHRACLRIAIVLAALAGTAGADPASDLAAAAHHFEDLDYELVLPATDAVIRAPAATPAQRVHALYLRGSALVVLERDSETATAFEAILTIDREFRPPASAPPRIRAAFASARAAWLIRVEEELTTKYGAQLKQVTLHVEPSVTAHGGQPWSVRIELQDPDHLVSRLVLGYRRDGDRDYSIVSMAATNRAELTVPGALLAADRDYKLAWFVHAVHASGAILRREGDDAAPRWLAVTRGRVPGPVPITRRWWFWTGATALAISAVAVPLLIARSRDVGPQQIMIGGE